MLEPQFVPKFCEGHKTFTIAYSECYAPTKQCDAPKIIHTREAEEEVGEASAKIELQNMQEQNIKYSTYKL